MDIFIARQPILDGKGKLFGYELLFRSSKDNFFAGTDFNHASASLIDDCVSVWGLDTIVPTGRAFINFGRDALLRGAHRVLPAGRVIIELLENVVVDAEVLAACRQLREDGYTIALDDFVWREDLLQLLPLVDIVKVDVLAIKGAERAALVERLRGMSVRLLAEKVETQEELAATRALGFSLFQGYYFCRPEMITRRETSVFKLNYLSLIDEVNRPTTTLDGLETIIKRDVALSIKLLRYLNSAGFGLRTKVTSIRQALCLLGESNLKKWVTVLAMRALGSDKPDELTATSLVRARFCELLAAGSPMSAQEQFLLGLLSTMDALLDRPMPQLVAEMPLAQSLRDVLMGAPTPLDKVYQLARAWERGDWQEVTSRARDAHLTEGELGAQYRQSLEWVRSVTGSIES